MTGKRRRGIIKRGSGRKGGEKRVLTEEILATTNVTVK